MVDGLVVLHKLECFVLSFLPMPMPQGKRCTMRNETSAPNIIISLTEQRVELWSADPFIEISNPQKKYNMQKHTSHREWSHEP